MYVLTTAENPQIYISTNIKFLLKQQKIGIHKFRWLHSN